MALLLFAMLIFANMANSLHIIDSLRGVRKAITRGFGTVAISGALISGIPIETHAMSDVQLYFGVGCFWHVQHEFVETERRVLKRSDSQITSTAGYAGGLTVEKDTNNPTNKNGLVCYHNLLGVGDYGKNGYGEVVGMTIPDANVKDFAEEYFSLFGADGDRPDKGDRGPEYRALLGLPGGVSSPLFPQIAEAAKSKGLTLLEGKGNDPDTLFKKTVYVMDTSKFPFRQAEVYHQFHDGFMPGEQYPEGYNSLSKLALSEGRIAKTGCPDI